LVEGELRTALEREISALFLESHELGGNGAPSVN
jgi:hypothetical protein